MSRRLMPAGCAHLKDLVDVLLQISVKPAPGLAGHLPAESDHERGFTTVVLVALCKMFAGNCGPRLQKKREGVNQVQPQVRFQPSCGRPVGRPNPIL